MAACLSPIVLFRKDRPNKDGFSSDMVPCGRCPACVQRRASMWAFRLKQELKVSSNADFLTLTYDNDNIRYSNNGLPTVCVRDHQLFMKRLRKYLGRKHKLRYYAVAEYGSISQRPHYHSILFNRPGALCGIDALQDIWSLGGIYVGDVTHASIAYVTKYMSKSIRIDRDDNDDRVPEFNLMSKGLGSNYLTNEMVQFNKNHLRPYLTIEDGKKQVMPRYYRDKMYTDEEKEIVRKKTIEHLEANPLFETWKQEIEYKNNQFRKRDKINREKRLVI